MEKTRRAIAWIDILGFATALESEVPDAHLVPGILKQWHYRYGNSQQNHRVTPADRLLSSQWFSDTLVLTASPEQVSLVARRAHEVYREIMRTGICLARGSVVIGDLFESFDFMQGPGLVQARRLEKKIEVPAIALDTCITPIQVKTARVGQLTIIDPLQGNDGFHEAWRKSWQRGLSEFACPCTREDMRIKAKYLWMESYQSIHEDQRCPSSLPER